jgi:peptide/nickel transport system substrate-binding protein
VLSLALAGCGSSSSNTGNGGTNQTPPPANINHINQTARDQVKDGGKFVWTTTQSVTQWNYNNVDGPEADNAAAVLAILPQTFYTAADGSLYVNKDLLDSADLTSKDPKQVVTYKINQKATWSNGTKISAADFIAQWNALKDANSKTFKIASATGYENIESVVAGSDDHTVVVTFAKKYADWQGLFSPLYDAATNSDPKRFNDGWRDGPLVSAGPFKFKNINKTAKITTLVRDPNWWGNPAKLDEIDFRVVDADAQVDSLASKEVDFVDLGVNASNYARAKTMQGITVLQAGGANWRNITLNGTNPFLKDVTVRRAIGQAIDRSQIARAELTPLGAAPVPLQNHIYMANQKGYQDNSGTDNAGKYDPAASKAALDAAGWKMGNGPYRQKDGQEFDINMVIPSQVKVSEQEAKLMQSMLAAVGIKLNIQVVPSQDLFDKYITPGRFGMTVFTWLGNTFAISSSKSIFASVKGDNVQQNFARVGSPELDALYDQAISELDPAKARDLGNQIDKAIWSLAGVFPDYGRPENVAVRSDMANFGAFGFASTIYEDMGYKKP